MQWSNRLQIIQVDPTSYCNAKCVSCVRNIDGGDNIPDLQLNHLDVDVWHRIMSVDTKDIKLKKIHFNGVWGDACMHPELIAICESIVEFHPEATITIATNGSLRTTKWFKELASVLCKAPEHKIEFAVDGLADTHHLYRRNTSFKKVCSNIKAFTKAGGMAQMVTTAFDYNLEQLDELTRVAKSLGCLEHKIRPSFDRNKTLKVYDNSYSITHDRAKHIQGEIITFKFQKTNTHGIREKARIKTPCVWYQDMRIQLDPWGTVWPCCWTANRAKQANANPFDIPGFVTEDNNVYNHKLLDILSNKWYNEELSDILANRKSVVCNKFCIDKTKHTNREV